MKLCYTNMTNRWSVYVLEGFKEGRGRKKKEGEGRRRKEKEGETCKEKEGKGTWRTGKQTTIDVQGSPPPILPAALFSPSPEVISYDVDVIPLIFNFNNELL